MVRSNKALVPLDRTGPGRFGLLLRGRRRRLSARGSHLNLLYVLPAMLFAAIFFYFAIAYTFWVSLLRWNGVAVESEFVGLANYARLLADATFLEALLHTATFAILAIFVQSGVGFLLAVLIQAKVRFKTVYRTLYFLPVVLAPAVVAYVFRQLYASDGQLNEFLRAIGLEVLAQSWLANQNTSLFAVSSMIIWEFAGFSFVMYLAGLTLIDREIFEAARLDGAGIWQTIRHVTLPLLRSTHATLVILSVVGALKIFEVVYLTTNGGPANSSEFLSTYLYRKTIIEFDAGYGATLAIVLIVVALILTVLQLRMYWGSSLRARE